MRASEKLVLVVALLVPVVVVTLGWPTFVKWVTGPPAAQPTPEVAGAAATSVAAARIGQPTPRPTIGAPPTVQPNGADDASAATPSAPTTVPAAGSTSTPVPTPRPAPAAPPTAAPVAGPTLETVAGPGPDDPSAAVASFYSLVSSHDFDTAAQLWSPRMRAAFPPQENIDQRFSRTQAIRLQRADVVNRDNAQATVAVDLIESVAQAGSRHYVGTWHLVRGAGGWMLDQPQLQPVTP